MKRLLPILILALALILSVGTIFALADEQVTVTFYDGETVASTESIAPGTTPTAPNVDEITVVDGIGYRFLGWTDTKGGTTPVEFTALEANATYYTVREAVAFKVTHKDGTVTWHKPDADTTVTPAVRAGNVFKTIIEGAIEGDTVLACMDFDVPSTNPTITKSITLDLGGNTVTTTGRVEPDDPVTFVIQNGVVDITKKEFIYLNEVGSYVSQSRVEFKNIVAKKSVDSVDKYLVEVRAGNVLLDNVTVNEGEWVAAKSTNSHALISSGYRSQAVSQPVNVEIKNSNLHLTGFSLMNTGGASGEKNGYALNITIDNSIINVQYHLLRMVPADTAVANCSLDMHITGNSSITTGSSTPISVSNKLTASKVNVLVDYGVYLSRKPKLAIGTLTLGEDGDGLLVSLESPPSGIVTDVWADDDYVPVTDYAYSFCVVGDIQYTVNTDPDNLHYLYDWILANKDGKKMQFVFGMGDNTNHDTEVEWELALEQISRLNGQIPYSLVRGNHDSSANYNAYFNNDAYTSQFEGFFSKDLIENSYLTFTVGEVKYLHITLDHLPSDSVIAWANNLVEEYYDHRVIISTHGYIDGDANRIPEGNNTTTGATNSGEQLWNKLIRKHENIFLVLCGHEFSTELACLQSEGDHGNTVTQLLTNGQTLDFKNGAMGLVSMLYFSDDGKTVSVEYYSTVYERHLGKSSQFTITVPEYTALEPVTHDYLYSITDAEGNTTTYTADTALSTALASISSSSTLTLYGDVSVDKDIEIPKSLAINLNGHTLSTDGGRLNINSNITVSAFGGTLKVVNKEIFYASEGNNSVKLTLTDMDVVHPGTNTSKVLLEVRGGTLTLDNVRVTSANWKGAYTFITAGSRTKSASVAVNVNIKNSSIDLGTANVPIVYYGGNTNEVNGYTANVTIVNSTLTTGGRIFKTSPQAASATKVYVNFSADANTVLNCVTLFEVASTIPVANVKINLAIGTTVSSLPYISGIAIGRSGGVFYPNGDAYTVVSEADMTGTYACKLVDIAGLSYLYVESNSFTKELVTMAQKAGCSIVLLADMTMPEGASSSSRYSVVVKVNDLKIDLNQHTLNMPIWSHFATEETSKRITIVNGTVKHIYNVFTSYTATDILLFEAENVTFDNRSTYTSFDHRIGDMKLTNCTISFLNSENVTSEWNVFTLGNTTRTLPTRVYMYGCTLSTTSPKHSIFKTYAGQPVTVVAEDCDFSIGSGAGYIIYAVNGKGLNPADSFLFKNTTLSKGGDNLSLFSMAYGSVTVTLDEVYVPTGSVCELTKGTLKYADGQVKAAVAEGGYMITAPKAQLEANLTLFTSFNLNIWLPLDTPVTSIVVGGYQYLVSEAQVFEGRYKLVIKGIAVNTAADAMSFEITYTDGGKTLTVTKEYSVIEYAEAILASDYSDEAKSLMVYAVDYISAAYAYSGIEAPTALTALVASEAYTTAKAATTSNGVASVPKTETDTGTAGVAIDSAKLLLDNSVRFIFTLNESYTGTLTLKYGESEVSYAVVGGKINGKSYIEINIYAYEMYSEVINITAGESTGSYDLAAYVEGTLSGEGENATLSQLLLGIYNYCKEASEYKAYTETLGELN